MSYKLFIAKLFSKILPSKFYLRLMVFFKSGEIISFSKPKTMNAKLQWKKINAYEPIHTIIADKLTVREHVTSVIGEEYLIPILKVYNQIDEISLEGLPDVFVFKSNNGSSNVKIINRKKENISDPELRDIAQRWFKDDYYGWTKERQYKDIKTKIFAEQYLSNELGEPPNDYKFHCFSGKVKFINVDMDRFKKHKRAFFDPGWNNVPFDWGEEYVEKVTNIEKPEKLEKMICLAEKLSKGFDYIRVDFYYARGRIYFGELTLHPTSGFKRFYPEEYNRKLGKLIMNPKG